MTQARSAARSPIEVFPDGERAEHELCVRAEAWGVADASTTMTFAQLVQTVLADSAPSARLASPLTSRLLLAACAGEATLKRPGLARALSEAVSEAKAAGLGLDELASSTRSLTSAQAERVGLLAHVWGRYAKAMADRGLLDGDDLIAQAASAIESRGWGGLLGGRDLVFRHLYDFSPLRLRFLFAAAQATRRATKTLRLCLPGTGNSALDGPVDWVMRQFEQRWATVEAEVSKDTAIGKPLEPVVRALFGRAGASGPPPPGMAVCVGVATPHEEARFIARRVRALLDGGARLDDIVVAFRGLDEEAELLGEALEELGVPSHIRLGVPLADTPLGRLAVELPRFVDEDFPAERVARYLESRFVAGISDELDGGSVLSQAGVRDDRVGTAGQGGAYRARLEDLARRAERRGQRALAGLARDLAGHVERLLACGRPFPAQGAVGELVAHWRRMLLELGLVASAALLGPRASPGSALLARTSLRALARDQRAALALDELTRELVESLECTGLTKVVWSRAQLHRWLSDAASDAHVTMGQVTSAVRIRDLRELPGLSPKHLFVGGCVDGRFPGRPDRSSFLSDDDKAALNRGVRRDAFRIAAGESEDRLPWGAAEDRLLLGVALTCPTGSLTLSHARSGHDGRGQVRSPYLDELQRAAGIETVAEASRAVPRFSDVETEEELRACVALEVLSPRSMRATEPDARAELLERRFGNEAWFVEARALAGVEKERLVFFSRESEPPRDFSGAVRRSQGLDLLRDVFRFDARRPASASQLGTLGNCPFRGFLALGLGLGDPDEAGDELDARGRGSFWHRTLERLVPLLAERGLLGRAPEELPDDLLEAAVREAAEAQEVAGNVGHPDLWRLAKKRAMQMLRDVLGGADAGLPFDGAAPVAVELSFGTASAPEGWKEVVVPPLRPGEEPVHLAGKIDRLDRGQGVGVLDYKSGRSRSPGQLLKQLVVSDFQLPIYLWAARANAADEPTQAGWMFLKDGSFVAFADVLGKAGQSLDELLSLDPAVRARLAEEGKLNFPEAIHRLVAAAREGLVPARPHDCLGCSLGAVCRITARRLGEESNA